MPVKLGLRVAVPSTVLPSSNVTVPTGVLLPPLLTLAVKVTAWPGADVVVDEVRVVVVVLG
jgi:hypothetical protein